MTLESIRSSFDEKVRRGMSRPITRRLHADMAEDRSQEALALVYMQYRRHAEQGHVLDDALLVHAARLRAEDLSRTVVGCDGRLAESGISTVPASAITGNLGVSPAAATYITGFSLILDSTTVFSTSSQVTGKAHAADYASPTPGALTSAVADMQLAFTDAAGRAPGVTELGAGNIGGMNLAPGVYKWGTGLLIPADITLTGTATAVWIFQIAQNLTISNGTKILLAGGALPKNIFWQVSGLVDIGTTAHCEGVILTQTAITLRTGASINGRLLAQTAVNLDSNFVVEPSP